jgi:hypothetical protein
VRCPRILVEHAGLSRHEEALAAYVDRRRWRQPQPFNAGIECVIRAQRTAKGLAFLVQGKAERGEKIAEGKFQFSDYEEAIDCLFAFIEAAGKWIEPRWFNRLLRNSSQKRKSVKPAPNNHWAGKTPKVREYVVGDKSLPLWKAFTRTLREMSRQQDNGNLVCIHDEEKITLRLPQNNVKMQFLLVKDGVMMSTDCGRERIGIVKTRSRGYAFELCGTLYSATRLAIEVLHEARALTERPQRTSTAGLVSSGASNKIAASLKTTIRRTAGGGKTAFVNAAQQTPP